MLNKNELLSKFKSLQMNWFSIYGWDQVNSLPYADYIASIICDVFDQIDNDYTGLRDAKSFNANHDGTLQLGSSIKDIREPRVCRALFNYKDLGKLGTAIDYEVPFKEKQGAKHGKIDLLSCDSNNVFIIEAKKDNNSILKGILQAFSYSLLVQQRRKKLFIDFERVQLNGDELITPAVLVFEDSKCGNELRELVEHRELNELLRRINEDCVNQNIGRLRFFTIVNYRKDIEGLLRAEPPNVTNVCNPTILFKTGFSPIIKEVIYEC